MRFLLISRTFWCPILFYFDLLRQVNEAGTYIVAAESGDLLYWDMATRKVVPSSPAIGCQHPTCPGGPPGEAREYPADLLLQEPVALCRRQQERKQGQRIRALRVQVFRKSSNLTEIGKLLFKVCARGNQTMGVRVSICYIHQGWYVIKLFQVVTICC